MCGRMNISNDPNVQAFMDALGIASYPANNNDLRPMDSTLLLSLWEVGGSKWPGKRRKRYYISGL
jgi:hypothetical protein